MKRNNQRQCHVTAKSNPLENIQMMHSVEQHILDLSSLFNITEHLLQYPSQARSRLCQEIERISQQRAKFLYKIKTMSSERQPFQQNNYYYPIIFEHWEYGTLSVLPAESNPSIPIIAEVSILNLSRACGSILFLLEQAMMIRILSKQVFLPEQIALTPRQQEVLAYISQGYSEEDIIEHLHIERETLKKHRQAIYRHLGVHSPQEIILAAHQAHLFSYTTTNAP